MSLFSVIVEQLSYALFPRRCNMCGKAIPPDSEFCDACADNIAWVEDEVCIHCGRGKKDCLCSNRRMFYEAVAAPFYYTGAVKKCIKGLKFVKAVQNADVLSDYMADSVRKHFADKHFDIVTCVPLSKEAAKRRGYNQSELLAKGLSKRMKLKFEAKLLSRTFQGEEQKNLSANRRFGSVFGSFDCVKSDIIKGKKILLCDDISTTGATFNECAKMLLLGGADEVYCIAAAVTKREVKQCSEQMSE